MPPSSSGERIAVMLSGGVDSAVAAALLWEAGADVTGVFMKNWTPLDQQSLSDCPWERDQQDAAAAAERLGIPFQSLNFEQDYKKRVVDYLLREYEMGLTPNPDVLCNREIKFGLFFDWAREQGFTAVASGHYARIGRLAGRSVVRRGRDRQKDQSYFLWTVRPDLLEAVRFPVGELTKAEVRRQAHKFGLSVADKPDSQGICFIGQLGLHDWLRQELKPEPGEVVTPAGRVVGRHDGSILYTIGQRHGLEIVDKRAVAEEFGLAKESLPRLFVIKKDRESNTITVAPTLAAASARRLELTAVQWSVPQGEFDQSDLTLQARYRQAARPVGGLRQKEGGLEVELDEPLPAPASGQFAVLYAGDAVVGGGVIVGYSNDEVGK